MKSFRLKSVLVVLFFAATFISCSSDDNSKPVDNSNSRAALVTNIQGPDKVKVNVETNFNITFTVDNTCGEFDRIANISIGKENGLQVEAKYPSETCAQQTPVSKTTTYIFMSPTKGTFEIKFKKSETEFLTKTIVIE